MTRRLGAVGPVNVVVERGQPVLENGCGGGIFVREFLGVRQRDGHRSSFRTARTSAAPAANLARARSSVDSSFTARRAVVPRTASISQS